MSRYKITLADYTNAIKNATDDGYRSHLIHDFVITDDGYAMPKVDFVKTGVNTYREQRANFTLSF